jgi:hypothetical protein
MPRSSRPHARTCCRSSPRGKIARTACGGDNGSAAILRERQG